MLAEYLWKTTESCHHFNFNGLHKSLRIQTVETFWYEYERRAIWSQLKSDLMLQKCTGAVIHI